MKYIIALFFMMSIACNTRINELKTLDRFKLEPGFEKDMAFYKGPLFARVQDSLDLTRVKKLNWLNTGIWLVPYSTDSNKIYACSSKGEVLFVRKILDGDNGTIGILKDGEAVGIIFTNGVRQIRELGGKEWGAFFTKTVHGGPGFCQRQLGEGFGDCFKAEADEFCDSFFSCLALQTQPQVSIILALACSCHVTKETRYEIDPYPSTGDTLIKVWERGDTLNFEP